MPEFFIPSCISFWTFCGFFHFFFFNIIIIYMLHAASVFHMTSPIHQSYANEANQIEGERSKEGYQRSCSCHHHQQQQPPPALSSSTSLIVPLSLSSPCGTQRARHRRQLKTSLNAFNFRCRRKEEKKKRNS